MLNGQIPSFRVLSRVFDGVTVVHDGYVVTSLTPRGKSDIGRLTPLVGLRVDIVCFLIANTEIDIPTWLELHAIREGE